VSTSHSIYNACVIGDHVTIEQLLFTE